LSKIHHAEADLELMEMEAAKRRQEIHLMQEEQRQEQNHNRFWTFVVVGILIFGALLIGWIVVCRI
jgi:heme/copper-type cytochrome/quinol oxidase subunit 3